MTEQLIYANITLNKPNKALKTQLLTQDSIIESLIQQGVVANGKKIQEQSEVRSKEYEANLDLREYCW